MTTEPVAWQVAAPDRPSGWDYKGDWRTAEDPDERLLYTAKAVERAGANERARIVAWLTEIGQVGYASAIQRGVHHD